MLQSVPNNTIVSYFNGVHLREKDVFSVNYKTGAISNKSPYLIELGEDDEYLDVPKELSSTDNYIASTGHKVNHMKDANGVFDECTHPRFGRIHCLVSTRVRLILG